MHDALSNYNIHLYLSGALCLRGEIVVFFFKSSKLTCNLSNANGRPSSSAITTIRNKNLARISKLKSHAEVIIAISAYDAFVLCIIQFNDSGDYAGNNV